MPFDDGTLTRPPALDLAAGHVTAARLRLAGRTVGDAASRLDGVATPSWAGAASEAASSSRVMVAARVRSVASVCASFAAAVERFLDEVGSLLPQWRYAVEEWHQLEDLAVASPDVPGWGAEAAAAQERAHRLSARYEQAVWELTAATDAVIEGLDVVRNWQDQVSEGLAQATDLLIAQPLVSGLYLGLGWTTDREGWWGTVRAAPSSTWDTVTHPRRTGGELLGEEHWRAGDWGMGAGTAIGVVSLSRRFPRVGLANRQRFPDAAWDATRPEPRVQSVDEMLAGVDLDAHESGTLGHSLRRHVVSDEYLADRALNGTITDQWTRDYIPRTASSWPDQEAAEAAITDALNLRIDDVRALARGEGRGVLRLSVPSDHVTGRGVPRADPSATPSEQHGMTIILRRTRSGVVYIETAFPGQ